ncbi:MAG: UDP-N-acetylmuramate--L-alanine ligase [Christensenellaceae bacterium]
MLSYNNYINKPKFYFIGIGGISMSALAKFLKTLDFEVAGSDRQKSSTTSELEKSGISVNYNHNGENVTGFDVIIYNSAIEGTNDELQTAIRMNKIVLKRAELLQILANDCKLKVGICGCHGKTTATAILAHILKYSQYKFLAHIGGNDNTFSNLYYNGNDVFLSEICEFDRNIDLFDMDIAVCLNVDKDHLNSYKNFDDLKNSYFRFLDRATVRIINSDDEILSLYDNSNISVSISDSNADYYSKNIENVDGFLIFDCYEKNEFLSKIKLKVKGVHNIYNVLVGVAVSRYLNIDIEKTLQGIASFCGIERRNELLGTYNDNVIIADYCHHPKEIMATMSSYENCDDVFVIFQPHTYSRTKFLFEDFIKTLNTINNLAVYKTFPAREESSQGIDASELSDNLNQCTYIDNEKELKVFLNSLRNKTILILGAGDLYDVVKRLIGDKG